MSARLRPMKMHLVCGGIVGSLLGLLLALPVAAQYKIVDADGSITYTDRPSPTAGAKITPLRRNSLPIEAPGAALPLVLRQAASRFPVTLYSAADCTACDSGRLLLQQRGVPYAERRVVSESDAAGLEAATGSRTLPALSIGAQTLRGLSPTDWAAYLDAAGYPRESRLPKGWQAPATAPLTERPAAPPAAQISAPAEPAAPPTPVPPEPAPSGVRF